jgi:hypothetical protein
MPLSRLKPPAKSCVQPTVADRWPSPRIAAVLLFPGCGPASCLSYRPLNQLSSRFILPWRSSSSEFLRSNLPLMSFDASKPTQGLFPHRGITGARPLFREGCQALASFRPQVFSTSRRFSPPSGCTGLFHPVATSRVAAVQGLLSPRSRAPSSRAPAPLPFFFSSAHLRWPHGCAFARRRDRRLPHS